MKKKKLEILYEDKEIIIVNKKAKMLTISTEKEQFHTLYREVSEYVKKAHPKNKVFIVNRLDKDTSGIVVFAKNEKMKKFLQDNWNKIAEREYFAIVEGHLTGKKVLKSYLTESKTFKVFSTQKEKGVLAITKYDSLLANKNYSLLKIIIETGKKHQIRVQLSEIGHPIIGDKKYGSTKNPIGRMALHASYLKLKMPNKEIICESKIPMEMKKMFIEKGEENGTFTKSDS